MKKAILIAASLITFGISGTLTTKANAQTRDFDVKAGTPGQIEFSGSGTAQFNNSLGTNNSFQVGSSTNLGVNANVSSTNGYGVDAVGNLQLAGSTQLQQVIGTSGTASDRVDTQSHEATNTHMKSWETTHGSKSTFDNTRYSSEREWQRAYDREYNNEYARQRSSSTSASSTNASDGSISGSFRTVESGTAQSSGDSTTWSADAKVKADADMNGTAWVDSGTGLDAGGRTKAEWQTAYDESYNAAYAKASAASNRYSDSTVNVTGIGSDANVFAAGGTDSVNDPGSNFNVTVNVLTDPTTGKSLSTTSTDTASGSAGASLATSSFANQSSSSTASGFLQAFGAQ